MMATVRKTQGHRHEAVVRDLNRMKLFFLVDDVDVSCHLCSFRRCFCAAEVFPDTDHVIFGLTADIDIDVDV